MFFDQKKISKTPIKPEKAIIRNTFASKNTKTFLEKFKTSPTFYIFQVNIEFYH
jgi:hypothetical protein